MAKKDEAKPVVTIRGDLKQRDVTALDLELARTGNYLLTKHASSRMAAYLKAAIGAKWIEEPECKVTGNNDERRYFFGDTDVDDLHPRVAYNAGKAVSDMYDDFTTVDPN